MALILDDDSLLDAADGFAGWDDALVDDTLAQELAQERAVELESELEQDERPIDYDAELEDAEEEAAPTSGKRLKRELRAEALRRLEDAARTAEDFAVVVEEWNKLDRNRERRERDHENLRGDVPLEYQAVPEPKIVPRWLNNPAVRQLCSGNFLDILFDCPYEMHQLTANAFLSQMIEELSEEHKEILWQHRTIAEASAVESPIRQETIGFPAHFFARAHNFKPPGRACQPEADSPMRT